MRKIEVNDSFKIQEINNTNVKWLITWVSLSILLMLTNQAEWWQLQSDISNNSDVPKISKSSKVNKAEEPTFEEETMRQEQFVKDVLTSVLHNSLSKEWKEKIVKRINEIKSKHLEVNWMWWKQLEEMWNWRFPSILELLTAEELASKWELTKKDLIVEQTAKSNKSLSKKEKIIYQEIADKDFFKIIAYVYDFNLKWHFGLLLAFLEEKQKSIEDLGYKYEIWIFNTKGIIIS